MKRLVFHFTLFVLLVNAADVQDVVASDQDFAQAPYKKIIQMELLNGFLFCPVASFCSSIDIQLLMR